MPDLDTHRLKEGAFSHYHGMCRLCHGAPGYQPEEFVKGLYPVPPSMTAGDIQKERSESEIYWIVKNGIKLTGMPAFGPTHDEDALWGLAILAKEIHQMNIEQYRQRAENQGEAGEGHRHGKLMGEKDHSNGHSKPSAHEDHEETK